MRCKAYWCSGMCGCRTRFTRQRPQVRTLTPTSPPVAETYGFGQLTHDSKGSTGWSQVTSSVRVRTRSPLCRRRYGSSIMSVAKPFVFALICQALGHASGTKHPRWSDPCPGASTGGHLLAAKLHVSGITRGGAPGPSEGGSAGSNPVGLPTSASATRPLTWRNEGRRPCCRV
jgi:hypothetical protein